MAVQEVKGVEYGIAEAGLFGSIPGKSAGRDANFVSQLLERLAWKQACSVLRGQWGREAPALPDAEKL